MSHSSHPADRVDVVGVKDATLLVGTGLLLNDAPPDDVAVVERRWSR